MTDELWARVYPLPVSVPPPEAPRRGNSSFGNSRANYLISMAI